MKFWWIWRHWTHRTSKKNKKQIWGRVHFGKRRFWMREYFCWQKQWQKSRITWVQWATLFWVYFASTKLGDATHAKHRDVWTKNTTSWNIKAMFFLSRIQHIAQQNTWAVSGCRYFFYWQDVCRTPSTARVTLIGGSPHLVSSLQPPFISYLGKFGRGTTPVRGLTIQS